MTGKFSKTNDDTVEKSLRPIYLTSYYTGILQDWCCDHHRPGRSIRTLRYISTTVVFLMLGSMLVFEIFQLGSELSKITSIHSILPNLLWICTFPLSLMVLIRYHFYRCDFLSFFDKWRRLEAWLVYVNASSSINWLSKFIVGSYALMSFGLFAGLYFLTQRQPDASFLLSSYPLMRKWFTLPVLSGIHVVLVFFSWILLSLADLVPALIFAYSARILNALNSEVERHFSVGDYVQGMRRTWLRYETLSQLTDKANRLFGWLIFIDYAVKFSMICVLFYVLCRNFFNQDADSFTFLFGAISYIFRLVACNILASRLHSESIRFESTVSSLVSLNCIDMTGQEREIIGFFLRRLEQNPLGAQVLGMIEITPKILLTMTSLIISYVIVLLQSK